MAKDARALRQEAAEANAAGRYKRALAAYLELERIEPHDAQWAKRAGETYKRLGNYKNAIEAFERSAERYALNGFLVQAIAVCKLILQIQPEHADTLRRLSQMSEQVGMGPTRAANMAENNPALHENPNVAAIRRASTGPQRVVSGDYDARPRKHPSTPPAIARTKSRPIKLPLGRPLDAVTLAQEVPEAELRDEGRAGIHVIPIDELPPDDAEPAAEPIDDDRGSGPIIEIMVPGEDSIDAELEEQHDMEVGDIEDIPLPSPRLLGHAAQRALAATPLFAGLPVEALQAMVENLALLGLEPDEPLFREGDPGDALYVVVEGELSVQSEGPPRVEMGRLGPGSFIGEVALLTDQPRTASVTAIHASELLRIDRVTLARVLGSHGEILCAILRFVRERLVDRWMRQSPLFRPFDETQRAELATQFTFLEIDAGIKLLEAGVRPDGLYIVLGGQFIVQRGGQALATLGPGDLIGETALLSGGAFKSDVIARGKSLALCLPAATFRDVIMRHPHVLEYIGEQAEHSRRLHIL
jgi:CRP-like cAMP-binding protein